MDTIRIDTIEQLAELADDTVLRAADGEWVQLIHYRSGPEFFVFGDERTERPRPEDFPLVVADVPVATAPEVVVVPEYVSPFGCSQTRAAPSTVAIVGDEGPEAVVPVIR